MIATRPPTYWQRSPIAISLMNVQHGMAHIHDKELEIVFCLSGAATVVTAHESLQLVPGRVVTLDQEDVHCIYADEENLLAVINLDLTRSAVYPFEDLRYRFIACATESEREHHRPALNRVREILLGLLYAYVAEAPYTKEQLQAVYERLLGLLVEDFSWPYRHDADAETNREIKGRLHSINKYVQQHYMEKITLAKLSAQENISENYLSQFMKNTSYGGFRQMLAYIRCYHAEILLLTTSLSGEEIADRCGFSSPKYYYRWFRYFWGRTPLQHKKWYEQYQGAKEQSQLYPPRAALQQVEQFVARELQHQVMGRAEG